MPQGANRKRERAYQELETKFKQEGRYRGREEEVAARIVNKQRAESGETKGEQQQARQGHAPDRDLPLSGYDHLAVDEIKARLERLSAAEITELRRYETRHKHRRGVLDALEARRK